MLDASKWNSSVQNEYPWRTSEVTYMHIHQGNPFTYKYSMNLKEIVDISTALFVLAPTITTFPIQKRF